MDHELSIDLILASLPNNFAQFVLNYKMNVKETTISDLINLLKTVEPTLKKEGKTVMLMDFFGSKKSFKNKKKRGNPLKHREVWLRRRQNKQPQNVLASIDGHWKINYKSYMEFMKKKTFDVASPSGIFVI